jgi:hypothetical protein
VRIYHLNKSATYKIVQDTSVILAASRGGEFTAYLALRSSDTRGLTGIARWEQPCMTECLIVARAAVILCFAVMPAEIVFDAIEAELGRRGVALWRLLSEAIHYARRLKRQRHPNETVAVVGRREQLVGARNDGARRTIGESRWILTPSRVGPQNKERAHVRHMRFQLKRCSRIALWSRPRCSTS